MRNTLAHPVTTGEILQCLDTFLMLHLSEQKCGDMRPLLLRAAADIVVRDRDNGQRACDLVDAMRKSTEEVPSHFIKAVEAMIPDTDSHGLPILP